MMEYNIFKSIIKVLGTPDSGYSVLVVGTPEQNRARLSALFSNPDLPTSMGLVVFENLHTYTTEQMMPLLSAMMNANLRVIATCDEKDLSKLDASITVKFIIAR
jgi:hypothetical protein